MSSNRDANMYMDFDDWYPPAVPKYDPEKQCLICGSEWKVTVFNKQVWYDCLKCGKTKEEITNDKHERR